MWTTARLALAILVACCVTTVMTPVHAQVGAPSPVVFTAILPRAVQISGGDVTLPGDLVVTKSRGNQSAGRFTLVNMVETLGELVDQGRSVASLVTVNGTSRLIKGMPIVLDNGDVKLRLGKVLEGRKAPRTNMDATYQAVACPPGQIPNIIPPYLQPPCMIAP